MIGKAEEGCSNHSPRYRILFICVPAVLYLKLRSMYYVLPLLLSTFTVRWFNYQLIYCYKNMQVTPKRNNTIHYLPQEIRETRLTEVTYLPITREMLEQLFSNSAKKEKHKLVKKRRKWTKQAAFEVTFHLLPFHYLLI